MIVSAIVAISNNRVIGKENDIYRILPISVLESTKRSSITLPSADKKEMLDFLRVTRSRLKHNGAKERRITTKDITPLKKMAQK